MNNTSKMILTLIIGCVLLITTWVLTFGHMLDIPIIRQLPWWSAILREATYIFGLMVFGASAVYGFEDDEKGEIM